MEQLALGALSSPRVLVDDATGHIAYAPAIVEAARAAAWFAVLRETTEWHHEQRPMYDRIVDVPRLTSHFASSTHWPPVILEAQAAVEAFVRARFNSVGLNYYRDGRDSVAMHNDHVEELVRRSPIALLSLGATRTMRIHSKARPRRTFEIALEAGSVFLMSGAAQEHWEHGIPKTSAPVGERISVAFRQRR